jgi:lipocalin
VRGSTDRSFIQIYSRTPNPGAAFIAEKKDVLRELGYPADDIVDTPQVGWAASEREETGA